MALGLSAAGLMLAVGVRADSYPLDEVSRTVPLRGRVDCPDTPIERYRGTYVRYRPTARIHPAFKPKLARFEALVLEVSRQVYGRPPRALRSLGTHACRRIRGYPTYLSEHAFGNALDVAGFDFGPVERSSELPAGLPRRLRRPFRVRLLDHWEGDGPVGAIHQRFLHELAHRVLDTPDLFRVILGPAWPGHHNHFHLDYAPYRVRAVF